MNASNLFVERSSAGPNHLCSFQTTTDPPQIGHERKTHISTHASILKQNGTHGPGHLPDKIYIKKKRGLKYCFVVPLNK